MAHLEGLGRLALHDRQAAFDPPELADQAAGQDEQQGQVYQIRPQGPEAALLMEIDFLVRAGLAPEAAQFPAQDSGTPGPGGRCLWAN